MKENLIFSNNIMIVNGLPIMEILEVEIIQKENFYG